MSHPDPSRPGTPAAQPGDPIDLSESVAGEEDPGASIDMPEAPAPSPTAEDAARRRDQPPR